MLLTCIYHIYYTCIKYVSAVWEDPQSILFCLHNTTEDSANFDGKTSVDHSFWKFVCTVWMISAGMLGLANYALQSPVQFVVGCRHNDEEKWDVPTHWPATFAAVYCEIPFFWEP